MKKNLLRLCAVALLLSMVLTGCTPDGGVTDTTTGDTNSPSPEETIGGGTTEPAETETEAEAETEAPDLSLKLVTDGASEYVIEYDSDLTKISAYTFREAVKQATGVELRMDNSEYGAPAGLPVRRQLLRRGRRGSGQLRL